MDNCAFTINMNVILYMKAWYSSQYHVYTWEKYK